MALFSRVATVAALLGAAGCADTPETRTLAAAVAGAALGAALAPEGERTQAAAAGAMIGVEMIAAEPAEEAY